MPAPFAYPSIKGTTAGAPSTGAFTPNAAATGFRAWSNVPAGWMGMVRYEDGTAWELTWSYYNGTTLSRGTNQRFDSSSGAVLDLSAAATAAMVPDPFEVQSDIAGTQWFGAKPQAGATNTTAFGQSSGPTVTGTANSDVPSNTNLLTQQIALRSNSATTASAQAGFTMAGNATFCHSTTAGLGGFLSTARWGATQLPTGPRLFAGVTSATQVGANEPSAKVGHIAGFGMDSTDTTIQLLTNDNSGTCTKINTGIAWAANGLYESSVWMEPGGTRVHGLLMRLDTGEIWYGSTTTDVPGTTAGLFAQVIGGLNATNTGTACVMKFVSMFTRGGC